MKHKRWPIYIWFLDNDLQKSAEALTEKALARSIDGCIGALVSTYFYFIGIRSKKHYGYWFSKEHVQETMDLHFPNWPNKKKKKPSFAAYGRKESKWCKMCGENRQYVISYLNILLNEFAYRHGSMHESQETADWIQFEMPKVDVPFAGLKEIVLPWKAIEPRFRRIDIIEGYRLQFMSFFEDADPFKAYANCPRDIPEFVLKHFNASQAFES